MLKLKIGNRKKVSPVAQGHFVYDLTLPLPQRTESKQFFASATMAANYLGVPNSRVFKNRVSQKRIFSPIHRRYFAVRIAPSASQKPEAMTAKTLANGKEGARAGAAV